MESALLDGGLLGETVEGLPVGFPEGSLVEVFGVPGKVESWPLGEKRPLDRAGTAKLLDPNGSIGRAVRCTDADDTYDIITFDSVCFGNVAHEHLKEYSPQASHEGGFDLVWPDNEQLQEVFAHSMATILQAQAFCVIQMWMSPADREAVLEQATDISEWMLPKVGMEATYMGLDNGTKFAVMDKDDACQEPQAALQRCDRIITATALFLEPYSEFLGCSLWGRLNGVLRVPLANGHEQQQLHQKADSVGNFTQENITGHLSFLEHRRLLIMFMIDNVGGDMWLHPKDDPETPRIRLPLGRNRLLIFRNDLFDYSYQPLAGPSIALQAWVMSSPPDHVEGHIVELPDELCGRRTHVRSISTSYPGQAMDPLQYWTMSTVGVDSQVRVPLARFDVDLYYSAEKEDGRSYTCHGAFISDERTMLFDNDFFSISVDDVLLMSPAQRLVMEVGYLALQQAGHQKASLHGFQCGVFLGDSGNEWPSICGATNRFEGQSNCVTGSRLSYCLGLRGCCSVIDTACSSSLVAVNVAHNALQTHPPGGPPSGISSRMNTALAIGVGLLLSERLYVLYCGPTMLSPRGRCFTFDGSADGFARGEGCGSILLTSGDGHDEADNMIACLAGSAVNQDGRSASMTAPHGPSQQLCILASMREMGLNANEITMAECHGTGTALGDPIEVSALRMVMQGRDVPILNTSAKPGIGHLEAAAGLAGLIKCVMSITVSCAPPNPHLRELNPNLDVNGYPVYFVNELVDYGSHQAFSGVSSFGFGGTNARGDLWGRCCIGPSSTSGVNAKERMDSNKALHGRLQEYGLPGPQSTDILYLCGSWDSYSQMQAMQQVDGDTYEGIVSLGDAGCERFYITVNGDRQRMFYPAVSSANQRSPVQGPDGDGEGKAWVIKGCAGHRHNGAIYRITFTWSFTWNLGEIAKISWQPATPSGPAQAVASRYQHRYFVVGSWTSWRFQEMFKSNTNNCSWMATVRVGLSGMEEFQFVRDGDWAQAIHPAVPSASMTSTPVVGPDDAGSGKCWVVHASQGETVDVELSIDDGEITVGVSCATLGTKTWRSRHVEYSVVGSWNRWTCSALTADSQAQGLFRCQLSVGEAGFEEFHILVGEDWRKQLYPHVAKALLGEGITCGPDKHGHGRNWMITGKVGQEFEITVNLAEFDKRWTVAWKEASRPCIAHVVRR